MLDEETDIDSKEDNKKKSKYLKIDWQSVDLKELIEHIDSWQNIKRTYKNIGGRHQLKRIHPDTS